jgi:hypothetical protein
MRKLLFALALLIMGSAAFNASTPAQAAPAVPRSAMGDVTKGGVEQIHWHHHHHWGFGSHWSFGGYWGYNRGYYGGYYPRYYGGYYPNYYGGYYPDYNWGFHRHRCGLRWSHRRHRWYRVCKWYW